MASLVAQTKFELARLLHHIEQQDILTQRNSIVSRICACRAEVDRLRASTGSMTAKCQILVATIDTLEAETGEQPDMYAKEIHCRAVFAKIAACQSEIDLIMSGIKGVSERCALLVNHIRDLEKQLANLPGAQVQDRAPVSLPLPRCAMGQQGPHGMLPWKVQLSDDRDYIEAAGSLKSAALQLSQDEQHDADVLPPHVTTLMLRNLPRGFNVTCLLHIWVPDGSFDFLHVPCNTRLKGTNCVAFINFTSNAAAQAFYRRWNGRALLDSSPKKMQITCADVQGLEASLANLKSRKPVPITMKDFEPAIFDGTKRLNYAKVMSGISIDGCSDISTSSGNASPTAPSD